MDGTDGRPDGGGDADTDRKRRQRRRAYVLAHHPDHGGDPDRFIAGLAALDGVAPSDDPAAGHEAARAKAAPDQARPASGRTPVRVVPDTAWPVSLVTAVSRRLLGRHRPARVR